MSLITGGELLERCLANEGVKFVFGLPSPEIVPAGRGRHQLGRMRSFKNSISSRSRKVGGNALRISLISAMRSGS